MRVSTSSAPAMSEYCAVPLNKAYLLLNHGPTTLVTSAHNGVHNVMAAAWAMPLDFKPPKIAVVIDSQTYSRQLIEASGELVLHVPSYAQASVTLGAGSISGCGIDKIGDLGFVTRPAATVSAPSLDGCLACLECRVIPEAHNQQSYDLFLAEVTAAWADPSVFSDGRWHIDNDAQRSIHYQSGGAFFASGASFEVAQK